jgi:hypothetical protein
MNKPVMSWHNEDGRLVCRWSEPEDSNREPAIPAEAPSAQLSEYWNADVVFELGDAA